MNFLITGGAGFIGTHVATVLLEHGHEIVLLDNLSNSNKNSILSLEKLAQTKITFYKVNICDEQALVSVFRQHNFDAVIHLH